MRIPTTNGVNASRPKRLPTVKRLYASDDQLKGARAFAEKREPMWQAR